eukprot:1836727-Prymnesium_polylepis.1
MGLWSTRGVSHLPGGASDVQVEEILEALGEGGLAQPAERARLRHHEGGAANHMGITWGSHGHGTWTWDMDMGHGTWTWMWTWGHVGRSERASIERARATKRGQRPPNEGKGLPHLGQGASAPPWSGRARL